MNEKKFTWVQAHEALTKKILEFKDSPQSFESCVETINDELINNGTVKKKNLESKDPFSFFASICAIECEINRKNMKKPKWSDKRTKVFNLINEKFNLDLIDENERYLGVPTIRADQRKFYCNEENENYIAVLWELFFVAVNLKLDDQKSKNDFIEKYDKACSFNDKNHNRGYLPTALYWIRPDCFVPIDKNTRKYLVDSYKVAKDIVRDYKNNPNLLGTEYINLCVKLKDEICPNNDDKYWIVKLSYNAYQKSKEIDDKKEDEDSMKKKNNDISLNTILYGPPGTGKTYDTIKYAVAIIENKPIDDIDKEIKNNDIIKVKERYDKYLSQGLIEFVTFHQSYGYEDFIEGIKPVLDGSNEIRYDVVPGVFKKFCESVHTDTENSYGFNDSPQIWKVSLAGTGNNPIREDCLKNGHIRIGYDSYGEVITDETDFEKEGGRNVLSAFLEMKKGDIVFSCYTAQTIDAIGVVDGDYEWHNEYSDYKRLRKVKWLVKGINEDITKINGGVSMTLPTVYRLTRVSFKDALDLVDKYKKDESGSSKDNDKNKVFIIDEINRGNISKIFGELITLIEESKRKGNECETEVVLPYSHKPFSVPNNVYILGTMNTADRSICAIDTALRRRFDFVEMMPNYKTLEAVEIEGIKIGKMLEVINKRIEVLYDREHTIGHAYLIGLKENGNIENLKNIFKKKIIPLLQEYFYEDYKKIRAVLGNSGFVKENKEINISNLFAVDSGIELDNEPTLSIDFDTIDNATAKDFIAIYEFVKTEISDNEQ